MTTVERVRVGDVLRLERREVHVDVTGEYEEIGVRSFGKGIFHKEPVDGVTLGEKRVFRIEPGDLVISNVFAWEGAIAVASAAEHGRIGSHRFMTFVASEGRIDTSWAAWYFLSDPGLELIRKASPGSAGRNKTLAVSRFEDLVIPLPPLEEQLRVAGCLDRARAATGQVAQLAARSLALAAALRASITLRDRDTRSWPRVPLGQILTLDLQETPVDPARSYAVAGVYSFGRGLFERGPMDGAQTSYRLLHELNAGQLVMSRLKAWEGALATVDDRFAGRFVSPEFPTFTADVDRVNPQFLDAVVTSEPFWGALGSSSKGIGARRERVHAERLLEQVISLPPIEEQNAMVRSMNRVDAARAMRPATDERVKAIVPALLNREFAALL